MRVTGLFFAWAAALYYLVAGIYWIVAHEVVGTTAIALTGGLATIIGFYMLYTAKRTGDLPEDQPFAEVSEADNEYGFFSPHSWWPLFVGMFAGVISLGLIFAAWLLILGIVGLLVAVTGWLFEYYRGDHLTW